MVAKVVQMSGNLIFVTPAALRKWDMRGRPPARKKGAYTAAERMRRYRRQLKRSRPSPQTVAKQRRRAERERTLGAKQMALPDLKCGVIVEDFEWDFEVRDRETGMDRHAANHYPVSEDAHTPEEIVKRTADRFACAAADCVLFMWATVPYLAVALEVMRLRGFRYVSNYTWGKDRSATGHWNRNKHEHLLIGVKGRIGSIPAPAPGTQWDSLIMSPKDRHSAKPECFLEMIEQYFPTLLKMELNRRGPPRPGWYAWGNEVETPTAAS
jgi:N6-adenosine-specific RNA methylase IME4